MDKQALITYWKKFFADLFVGSIIRLTLYSGFGCIAGFFSTFLFKSISLSSLDISDWLVWIYLGLVLIWNICFGIFHGFIGATIQTISQKLHEVTAGLQDLLDMLSKEVLTKLNSLNKTYQKEEAARIFSQMGDNFLKNLELKGGVQGILGSLFFGFIIKVLRFLFLNEISDRLLAKPGNEATTSDIESAVRRVGVNKMLEPIGDNLALAQVANVVLFILSFGFPFFIIWIFT
jgi:hypothetical protein